MKPKHKMNWLPNSALVKRAVFASSLILAPPLAAEIYKTTDAQGNVVFTDVPPSQGAEALTVEKHSTYTPPIEEIRPTVKLSPTEYDVAVEGDETAEANNTYESLIITSPESDMTVRNNAGSVTISVQATPELDASQGHVLEVLIDGTVSASGPDSQVTIENIDRGAHNIAANIVDGNGQVLISSDIQTFHLQRFSQLNRNRAN